MSDLLQRLRAYAAANPTDVKVIAETIQHAAELEALEALAALARKWQNRSSLVTVAKVGRALRDIAPLVFDHEPFPLTRRVVKVCGVRVPAPRSPSASWPGW